MHNRYTLITAHPCSPGNFCRAGGPLKPMKGKLMKGPVHLTMNSARSAIVNIFPRTESTFLKVPSEVLPAVFTRQRCQKLGTEI